MLFLNIKRVIRSGLIDFWRNSFVSLASIIVMTVTLFVIGSIVFVGVLLDSSLQQLKNKVDINVYFVTAAADADIAALQTSLEGLPEVAEVIFTSRDQALSQFTERHENDELTLQALDELGENPLGASLSIRAKETSQYEGIAQFLEDQQSAQETEAPLIDKVNYFQNRVAIEKLTSIIDVAERVGFALMIIFIVASVLITFNTLRLAIYTSREEIGVMRLVGASNTYIRGPFIFEGVLYGVISGVLTLLIFYPVTLWLGPMTESFFGNINIFNYYVNNFGYIFTVIVGSGIALGALSSFLAIKRYLKV